MRFNLKTNNCLIYFYVITMLNYLIYVLKNKVIKSLELIINFSNNSEIIPKI